MTEQLFPKRLLFIAFLVFTAVGLSACVSDYDPIAFEAQGDRLVAKGVVDGRALRSFQEAVAANPNVKILELAWVPGSADDDTNLRLGRTVRSMGFTTTVPSEGLVSSGGTDLFLAGKQRILAANACVGVHSWGDGWVGSGAEVPKDDPIHQQYLDYYRDMGIDPNFYWFTLQAADIDGMHWMSAREHRKFGFETAPLPGDASNATAGAAACEARLQ